MNYEEIEKQFDCVIFIAPDGFQGFAYISCLHKPGFYEGCRLYGVKKNIGIHGEPVLNTVAEFSAEKGWSFYD